MKSYIPVHKIMQMNQTHGSCILIHLLFQTKASFTEICNYPFILYMYIHNYMHDI